MDAIIDESISWMKGSVFERSIALCDWRVWRRGSVVFHCACWWLLINEDVWRVSWNSGSASVKYSDSVHRVLWMKSRFSVCDSCATFGRFPLGSLTDCTHSRTCLWLRLKSCVLLVVCLSFWLEKLRHEIFLSRLHNDFTPLSRGKTSGSAGSSATGGWKKPVSVCEVGDKWRH